MPLFEEPRDGPPLASLAARGHQDRHELKRQRYGGERKACSAAGRRKIARAEAKERGDVAADDAVGVAGDRGGRAMAAARLAASLPKAPQELVARAARRRRPRAADAP